MPKDSTARSLKPCKSSRRSWTRLSTFWPQKGRVELRNFGVFVVKRRKPRRSRNPRTGEKIMVGERFTVTFKPGRAVGVGERVAADCGGGAVQAEEAVAGE